MELGTLNAERRLSRGTRAARALRQAGQLPVVIYGHGEPVETVSLSFDEVESSLLHGARTLDVKVDGKVQQYLIKDVQYDHLGTTPIHVDLARVSVGERVKVRIGIELRGVPEGVSQGGVLDQHLADLEIECLVTEIPQTLQPLVAHLGLGESLYVKDLDIAPGITIMTDPDERVATVRAMVEEPKPAEAEEESEGESTEPERIGRVRKEEESGGAAGS